MKEESPRVGRISSFLIKENHVNESSEPLQYLSKTMIALEETKIIPSRPPVQLPKHPDKITFEQNCQHCLRVKIHF